MKTRIGVAALMVLFAASPASSWNCSSNCSCGVGPGYVYADCPSTRRSLNIYNMFRNYIKITCYQATADEMNLLQSFDVGPTTTVYLKQCPLPQTNYSVFLESIGAQNYSRLDICDNNLSATDLRDSLSGLDNVTSLSLNYLDLKDVPDDFFKFVPHIKNLDLRYNKLLFPLGIFDHVPNLQTLEISGNGLNYLEPGIFRNLNQLYSLGTWFNSLRNLTRETFVGLNKLERLDITNNGIQELPDDVFAELHSLKRLGMPANNFIRLPRNLFRNTVMLEWVRLNDNRRELATLPPGFLANLTNLREVYLHRMSLSNIPEDVFHGSGSLVNVTLYSNHLRSLPAGLFRDTVHLLQLDLSRNKLEHLPDNIFSTLSELQFLDLSNNKLTAINKVVFETLSGMKTLYLQQNAITQVDQMAFRNLEKLQLLDISNNMVSFNNNMGYSSPLNACKNLEHLYLANNSIRNIFDDWRNVLLSLKVLDLSYNEITYIEVADLIFLSSNIKVNLTHNNISTINLRGSDAIASGSAKKNVTIYLDNNPLQCNCMVYDFLRYLQFKVSPEVHNMFELVPGNLECVSPPMHKGLQVSAISTDNFVCDCNEAYLLKLVRCPGSCSCCIKPFMKALVVDCSDSGLLQAPDELPITTNLTVTQTQLLLQSNSITSLPSATQPGYETVTLIDVSYNRLNTLSIAQIPEKLKVLNLDHNSLTQLDKSVLSYLENRTVVTLQANPWTCSCENRDLLSFLQSNYKQVLDFRNITCKAENGSKLALPPMSVDDLCPTDVTLFVILGVTIGVVGLLVGAIATLYYRFHQEVKVWLYAHNMLLWWVTEEELDKDKLFDAFVSFSHKDEDFVVNELVPGLEDGPKPFKLCLHFRDWIAGEFIPLQIARSVTESRRTLVVLSPNFLESVWGRMEFRAAHQQALSEGRARVILLLYGDIGPLENLDPELKTYLSMNTYVKWGDPWFWDKLRYALPHRSPIKQKQYHINAAAVSDKMDLMFPAMSVPAATTPPADSINPVFIIEDKAAAEKEAKLNGQLMIIDSQNGYIKCV